MRMATSAFARTTQTSSPRFSSENKKKFKSKNQPFASPTDICFFSQRSEVNEENCEQEMQEQVKSDKCNGWLCTVKNQYERTYERRMVTAIYSLSKVLPKEMVDEVFYKL